MSAMTRESCGHSPPARGSSSRSRRPPLRSAGGRSGAAERAMGALALEVPSADAARASQTGLADGPQTGPASDDCPATLTPLPRHTRSRLRGFRRRAEPERPSMRSPSMKSPSMGSPPRHLPPRGRLHRARAQVPASASAPLGERPGARVGLLSIRWQEERATEVEPGEPPRSHRGAPRRRTTAPGSARSGPLDRELWAWRGTGPRSRNHP
jgi:hypothetical protein